MTERIAKLREFAKAIKLDQLLVSGEANVRALIGIACDNAMLSLVGDKIEFFTDFRYFAMAHRVAPKLRVKDIRQFKPSGKRIGIEFSMSYSRLMMLKKATKKAKFIDITEKLAELRAIKTPEEIKKLCAAEKLTCEIWNVARKRFRKGMSEREMANVIKKMMIDRGDGEAFETIVCVGKNAAECHHRPNDTIWDGNEPVLVDMGIKFEGVCSDLTRNILPRRMNKTYQRVFNLVKTANQAAIKAAKPGITGAQLDKVARDIICKGGFGKCFGHSLGHGVGYEIHEAPTASQNGEMVLKPGMLVTVEPGIYLEGNLGVRIEDLILITDDGATVLSSWARQ